MRKLLGLVAAILILIGAAAIIFWNEGVRNVFAGIGAIFSCAFAYYLLFPQRAKIIASDIAGIISFSGGWVRRFRVKYQIEGYINTVTDRFDNICAGVTQYPIKLIWVTRDLVPRSYIERERVIVRLKYKDPAHLNVVAASMAYCHTGLLPETRQYIRKPVLRAIDLKVVDIILNENKMREGQRYFRSEVLPAQLKMYKDLQPWLDIILELDDRGYFWRILLPELTKYPIRAHFAICTESHRGEICEFLEFLKNIADSPPGGEVNLDFIGNRLQLGIIIVGVASKIREEGYTPYLTQIELCRNRGAEVVYLIGVKDAAREIPSIAREAEYLGLVNIIDSRKITRIKYRDGTIVAGHCAQLEVKQLA